MEKIGLMIRERAKYYAGEIRQTGYYFIKWNL